MTKNILQHPSFKSSLKSKGNARLLSESQNQVFNSTDGEAEPEKERDSSKSQDSVIAGPSTENCKRLGGPLQGTSLHHPLIAIPSPQDPDFAQQKPESSEPMILNNLKVGTLSS